MAGKEKRNSHSNAPASKLWVRLMCGFLGVVMVLAIVFMLIQTTIALRADDLIENSEQTVSSTEISVGLCYGENAVQSFTLASASGFSIRNSSDKELFSSDHLSLIFCPDEKLSFEGDKVQNSQLGIPLAENYHIQVSSYSFRTEVGSDVDNPALIHPSQGESQKQDRYSKDNISKYIRDLEDSKLLIPYTESVYPACVNGSYYIRIGQFADRQSAEEMLEVLNGFLVLDAEIAEADEKGFTVIDGTDHSVVCEVVTSDGAVKLRSQQGKLTDNDGKEFNGDLSLIREKNIKVINTFSLEDYVSAVLPEILSEDYPEEALKAAAVLFRTNAFRMLKRHQSDGFDVCTDHHCCIYNGVSDPSSVFAQAVADTEGQILTYHQNPIYAPYSFSIGKRTLSAAETMETDLYPYLQSVSTPWEEPSAWQMAISPETIRRMLNTAGYSQIRSSVTEISVETDDFGSGYVQKITFIDRYGESVTLVGSEKIRLFFGGQLPSTQFTVSVSDGSTGDVRYGFFIFRGYGEGSGVGFSILGAAALAKEGADYATVLEKYFIGVEIAVR